MSDPIEVSNPDAPLTASVPSPPRSHASPPPPAVAPLLTQPYKFNAAKDAQENDAAKVSEGVGRLGTAQGKNEGRERVTRDACVAWGRRRGGGRGSPPLSSLREPAVGTASPRARFFSPIFFFFSPRQARCEPGRANTTPPPGRLFFFRPAHEPPCPPTSGCLTARPPHTRVPPHVSDAPSVLTARLAPFFTPVKTCVSAQEGQPTIGGGYNLLKRIRSVYSHDERPYHAFLAILIRFRNAEFTTEQVRGNIGNLTRTRVEIVTSRASRPQRAPAAAAAHVGKGASESSVYLLAPLGQAGQVSPLGGKERPVVPCLSSGKTSGLGRREGRIFDTDERACSSLRHRGPVSCLSRHSSL